MGREENALAAARKNVDAWTRAIESDGLDAIVITASGCGTTIKDYGFMLRLDPAYAGRPRGSPLWQRTSRNIWRRSICPRRRREPGHRGLSFGLFHAAWPEDQDVAEGFCARGL
jgi:hypothetical protein